MSGFANHNYAASINAIKMDNGGELPSELYLLTNQKLIELLFDETGKWATATTSKKRLVERIEKHRQKAAQEKEKVIEENSKKRARSAEEDTEVPKKAAKKTTKRGCLSSPSKGNIAEMRRILDNVNPNEHMHKELETMWKRMGVIAQYPKRDSKANIIKRMCEFAERNLEFHNLDR